MKRKWFLLEYLSGGTDVSMQHHVAHPKATHAACGRPLPRANQGLCVQHYPKKQPPKCGACRRAVARQA